MIGMDILSLNTYVQPVRVCLIPLLETKENNLVCDFSGLVTYLMIDQ